MRQQIGLNGDALHSSAQLLSERPTLRRLIDQRDQSGLRAFFTQFTQTDHLDGTVVMEGGQVLAQAGDNMPWTNLWASRKRPRHIILSRVWDDGAVAGWSMDGGAGGRAVCDRHVQRLDQQL